MVAPILIILAAIAIIAIFSGGWLSISGSAIFNNIPAWVWVGLVILMVAIMWRRRR